MTRQTPPPPAIAVDAEAEAGQPALGVGGGDLGAGEGVQPRAGRAGRGGARSRLGAHVDRAGEHRAARHLGDQRRGAAHRLGADLRVGAALEAVAGVGVHAEPAGRRRAPAGGRSGRPRSGCRGWRP